MLKEIANQTAELSLEEREELSKSIDDLVRDTPRTEWAVREFKRLMKKVPKETWDTIRTHELKLTSASPRQGLRHRVTSSPLA